MTDLTKLSTTERIYRQEVELALPSTDNAVRLQEFIYKARETLEARMLRMTGSWRGSLITYEVQRPITTDNMLDKLTKIPGVKKAEEIRTKKQDITRRRIEVILSTGFIADDHKAVTSISSDAAIPMTNISVDNQLDTDGPALEVFKEDNGDKQDFSGDDQKGRHRATAPRMV